MTEPTTAARQVCPRGFQSHVMCNCKPATAAEQPWVEIPGGVRVRARLCTTLADLPPGMYHANRYDTDDHHVLHLWTDEGQSFDIRRRRDDT